MYYVSKGYVHKSKVLESQMMNNESLYEAVDCQGRTGYAWSENDSEDTYIFMPYDDEVHDNWQINEFVYIETKLNTEIRRQDEKIREESRQVLT